MLKTIIQLVTTLESLYESTLPPSIVNNKHLSEGEKDLVIAIINDKQITMSEAVKLLGYSTLLNKKTFSTRLSRLRSKLINHLALSAPELASERIRISHIQSFNLHIGMTLSRAGARAVAKQHLTAVVQNSVYMDNLPLVIQAQKFLLVDTSSHRQLADTVKAGNEVVQNAADLLQTVQIQAMTSIMRAANKQTTQHKEALADVGARATKFLCELDSTDYSPHVGIAAARLATGAAQITGNIDLALYWLEQHKRCALQLNQWDTVHQREYHVQRVFVLEHFHRFDETISELYATLPLMKRESQSWYQSNKSLSNLLLMQNRISEAIDVIDAITSSPTFPQQYEVLRHDIHLNQLYAYVVSGRAIPNKMWKEVMKEDTGIAHHISLLSMLSTRKKDAILYADKAESFTRAVTRSKSLMRDTQLTILAKLVRRLIITDMNIDVARKSASFLKLERSIHTPSASEVSYAIVPWVIIWDLLIEQQ